MNFEDWQKVWQNEPAPRQEDAKVVLTEVRKQARAFGRSILWRDIREVVAALIVVLAFGWTALAAEREGASAGLCWAAAVMPLGVACYLLVDRQRARRLRSKGGETVLAELDRTLAELRHQAWLLRNVFWWYLMPLGVSVGLFGAFVVTQTPLPTNARAIVATIIVLVSAAVFVGVWWLNRHTVRRHLEPRIRELEEQRQMLDAPPAEAEREHANG